MKLGAYFKEAEGKKYYYVAVGSGEYRRTVYRIWCKPEFFTPDWWLELPMKGVNLKEGKSKNNLILQKGDKNLYIVEIYPGYRGEGWITDIEAGEDAKVWRFPLYQSERGNLGIGEGAIILTSANRVKVSWGRSGRLYGDNPVGATIYTINGEEIEEIED